MKSLAVFYRLLNEIHLNKQKSMEFRHMDFSLMETEDLEIILKVTEIDIQLAELEEKQRKANRKEKMDEGSMDQGLAYEENFIWSVREPAG